MARNQKSTIFDHLGAIPARIGRLVGEIKAGFDALHRVQFDEPWKRAHRPTYEEWQDYIAPRPSAARPKRPVETLTARPASR